MAVNLVTGANAALNNAGSNAAVGIAVLKKAIDLQAQGAAQLLQTLPAPPAGNPPHLGNHLDTFG
jgi:Putative motility protein